MAITSQTFLSVGPPFFTDGRVMRVRARRRHFGMRAVTFASSARPAQLAERAVAAAERRRASGLVDRCGREGTDVRARARRHTDACS